MGIIKHLKGFFKYLKISHKAEFLFYAEDKATYSYLSPIIDGLLDLGESVIYVTSDENDPVISHESASFFPVCLGAGIFRTMLFEFVKNKIFVMTMPDLELFHLKRNPRAENSYVYVFHSLVSANLTYYKESLKFYDHVLCAGPHHKAEISKAEILYDWKRKGLHEVGYPKLDDLIKKNNQIVSKDRDAILLAPSWGPQGLFESIGVDFLRTILVKEICLIVRPHPHTLNLHPKIRVELIKLKKEFENLTLDLDIRSFSSLARAKYLVSDWSGLALEYALVFKRPVFFLDTPIKRINNSYQELEIVPIEISIRNSIGKVITIEDFLQLDFNNENLFEQLRSYEDTINNLRNEIVYNVGESGLKGAQKLIEIKRDFLLKISR